MLSLQFYQSHKNILFTVQSMFTIYPNHTCLLLDYLDSLCLQLIAMSCRIYMLPMAIKCVSLDFTEQTERRLSIVSFLIPLTMFFTNSGTQAVADDRKTNP